jgi:tRNA pseudouridine55 synthase
VPQLVPDSIDAVLCTLRGRIEQTPPVYSAIKQGGVALYKRARRGEDVKVPVRVVDIYRLELTGHLGESLDLHVECGSGTYVRSLARDLGERLGCGAHLAALRRLWVDPFREPLMWRIEQLVEREAADGVSALDALLLPIEQGLRLLPSLDLDSGEALALAQGKRFTRTNAAAQPICRAVDAAGRLVALVAIDDRGEVRVLRGFNGSSA